MLLMVNILNYLIPSTYAEDQKTIRNKKIYDAEWTFAQTIVKAKEDYSKKLSDPNQSNEEKIKAAAFKNKVISDAKIVKEKTIADAWNEYNVGITTKGTTEKAKFCFLWWCW
jgi:hypothetical protein